MFLLDTMVISEGFKRQPSANVLDWLRSQDQADLYVSAITFGEIAAGVEKQSGLNATAARRLGEWLEETREVFRERTLPVDTETAVMWGTLYTRLKRRDTDLLIAATALHRGYAVVTRNVRHFEPTGVRLFNPYDTR
jgi:predicted nucleic acid-binding protein